MTTYITNHHSQNSSAGTNYHLSEVKQNTGGRSTVPKYNSVKKGGKISEYFTRVF